MTHISFHRIRTQLALDGDKDLYEMNTNKLPLSEHSFHKTDWKLTIWLNLFKTPLSVEQLLNPLVVKFPFVAITIWSLKWRSLRSTKESYAQSMLAETHSLIQAPRIFWIQKSSVVDKKCTRLNSDRVVVSQVQHRGTDSKQHILVWSNTNYLKLTMNASVVIC